MNFLILIKLLFIKKFYLLLIIKNSLLQIKNSYVLKLNCID